MKTLTKPCCRLCGAPTAWPVDRCRECVGRRLSFASARAAVLYVDPVPAFVRAWKERGLRRCSALAADLVVAQVERPDADGLVYVPPDPRRQLERGTHPAAALAAELVTRWEIELLGELGRVGGRRRRQLGLTGGERQDNVRGLFVQRREIRGTVVLVDDVYTTGATAAAAAAALRLGGATRVDVITFARTVRYAQTPRPGHRRRGGER